MEDNKSKKRNRVPLSCSVCRKRKSKCDRTRPVCGTCKKKSIAHLCFYDNNINDKNSNSSNSSCHESESSTIVQSSQNDFNQSDQSFQAPHLNSIGTEIIPNEKPPPSYNEQNIPVSNGNQPRGQNGLFYVPGQQTIPHIPISFAERYAPMQHSILQLTPTDRILPTPLKGAVSFGNQLPPCQLPTQPTFDFKLPNASDANPGPSACSSSHQDTHSSKVHCKESSDVKLVPIVLGIKSTLLVSPVDVLNIADDASYSLQIEGNFWQQQGLLSYVGLTKSDPFLKIFRNYALTLFKSGQITQFVIAAKKKKKAGKKRSAKTKREREKSANKKLKRNLEKISESFKSKNLDDRGSNTGIDDHDQSKCDKILNLLENGEEIINKIYEAPPHYGLKQNEIAKFINASSKSSQGKEISVPCDFKVPVGNPERSASPQKVQQNDSSSSTSPTSSSSSPSSSSAEEEYDDDSEIEREGDVEVDDTLILSKISDKRREKNEKYQKSFEIVSYLKRFHQSHSAKLDYYKIIKKITLNCLPCCKNMLFLYIRFFKYVLPFVPVIDETTAVYDADSLFPELFPKYKGRYKKMRLSSPDDLNKLATCLLIMRLGYLSLIHNESSYNGQNEEEKSILADMERISSKDFNDLLKMCIQDDPNNKKSSFKLVQCLCLSHFYNGIVPDNCYGIGGTDSQILFGTIVTHAFSIGLNRDPLKFSTHDSIILDETLTQTWRRIWRYIEVTDALFAIRTGSLLNITDLSMSDVKDPDDSTSQELSTLDKDIKEISLKYRRLISLIFNVKQQPKVIDLLTEASALEMKFVEIFGKDFFKNVISKNNEVEDDKQSLETPKQREKRIIKVTKYIHFVEMRSNLSCLYYKIALFYENQYASTKQTSRTGVELFKIYITCVVQLVYIMSFALDNSVQIFGKNLDYILTAANEKCMIQTHAFFASFFIRMISYKKELMEKIEGHTENDDKEKELILIMRNLDKLLMMVLTETELFVGNIRKLSRRYSNSFRLHVLTYFILRQCVENPNVFFENNVKGNRFYHEGPNILSLLTVNELDDLCKLCEEFMVAKNELQKQRAQSENREQQSQQQEHQQQEHQQQHQQQHHHQHQHHYQHQHPNQHPHQQQQQQLQQLQHDQEGSNGRTNIVQVDYDNAIKGSQRIPAGIPYSGLNMLQSVTDKNFTEPNEISADVTNILGLGDFENPHLLHDDIVKVLELFVDEGI